ncbi:hypothetical protein B0J17DRAFT_627598 [Rhizoctonia solani]|nr:hypothetical protein B0J17DRAFT_627598 [Rhizoctonia solani]
MDTSSLTSSLKRTTSGASQQYDLPEGAFTTEVNNEGYFHRVEYHITTNIDIICSSKVDEVIVKHATQRDHNADEFIETIAMNTPGSEANETGYTPYYVPVTDGKFSTGNNDSHSSSVANPTYIAWIELVMRSRASYEKPKESLSVALGRT